MSSILTLYIYSKFLHWNGFHIIWDFKQQILPVIRHFYIINCSIDKTIELILVLLKMMSGFSRWPQLP